MQQPISDEQLVQQYLHGSDPAFELLVQRHKSKVYTSIYMFVRDRYVAEDLFQETFIRAVKFLRTGGYRQEGKFLPWLMRIAKNLCIDDYRYYKKFPVITVGDGTNVFDAFEFDDSNAEKQMIRQEKHERIRDMIDQLPLEQKEVVILRHWACLSFKEIAVITGVNLNTCLGRMRYALKRLRKMELEKKAQKQRVLK